jgi:glycosyltransferase involved in cell wall biosynthesis
MRLSIPPLSRLDPRRILRRLGRRLRGDGRSFFDIHDCDLVNRLLRAHGLPAISGTDGDPVRGARVYEIRDDVRGAIPLALTPAQRGTYLEWFLAFGRHETDAAPQDVLRHLLELDGSPDLGLVTTYLMQPHWQERCPDALTSAGWGGFKDWLAAEYGIRGRWFRRTALPEKYAKPGDDPRPGVNVIGLFRYPSGLQHAAEVVVDALTRAGIRTALRDIPVRTTRDNRPRDGFDSLERFPVTILNSGLDYSAADAYRVAGLHRRSGVYRVAVWWWELDRLPPEWRDRGRDVDEIWAPTAFVARSFAPLGKPVVPMPPSVELPPFDPLAKSHFGLDPGRFTFLFVFDMNSRMARKNPLGLIEAFRRAFRSSDPVELAIKVTPPEKHYATAWQSLRAAAAEAGVKLIDRLMPRGELLALMNAADAYVSLHRSEGFGLTMAEAMLLGKPTAATAYSGPLDFMTPQNSYLIDHVLVPVDSPDMNAPPGAVWAEPSIEHAAAVMRRILEQPDEARERARRAQKELRVKLSHAAAGERMAARLRLILGVRR